MQRDGLYLFSPAGNSEHPAGTGDPWRRPADPPQAYRCTRSTGRHPTRAAAFLFIAPGKKYLLAGRDPGPNREVFNRSLTNIPALI
ncbi:hypothetical protein ASZ90_009001 [hydrocarbon metagenome]|uniref:Uncharacterized protein n=1 Tax=hydrocarbon metagenome TaxID=938273 RepID=A0A0W8FK34_9ZZZZ